MKRYCSRRTFRRHSAVCLLACLLAATLPARASIAVLLEQPYGSGSGMEPAGHSAIYLDHVCAASLTQLRVCAPGELGAVVSRYKAVGGYDWMAMPLVAYLYAVESPDAIPETMDAAGEARLRDAYRRVHLQAVAPDRADGSTPGGNWYQLAGAAYDRAIYGFEVKTDAAQDAALIASFNDTPNKDHFSGFFHNCADLTRQMVNFYYPGVVHRNFISDFGFTSPKQVARNLAHYGKKHPEVDFSEFVIPQVPGTLPRSHANRGAMETLALSKRYIIPIAIVEPYAAVGVMTGYLTAGRFSLPKNAPVLSVRAMQSAADATAHPQLAQSGSTGFAASVSQPSPMPVTYVNSGNSAVVEPQY